MTTNYLGKKVSSHYEKGKALGEFVSRIEKHYRQTFYQAIDMVVNCIRELQQLSLLFSIDLDKFKLETQLKTSKHIVDEKQVGKKDAIKIILSLNTYQSLLVSQVLTFLRRSFYNHFHNILKTF